MLRTSTPLLPESLAELLHPLRHAADLGVVGGGNAPAVERAVAASQAAGDTVEPDVAALASAPDGGRTA